MPTFIGETALAALKTALETIVADTGQTWQTTIAPTVLRGRVHDRAAPRLPMIVIGKHVENFIRHGVYGSTNIYEIRSTVDVRFLFDSKTWVPDTDASKATHDLIKAVKDHTLGGAVSSLSILTMQTILPNEEEDPFCGVLMQLELMYLMNEDDPTVAIS